MDPVPPDFDPNAYYRLINLALGPSQSLDVYNPPDGSVLFASTGPFQGQIWQLLRADTAGSYFISSNFLGAKLKLDVLPNERGDFVPYLRNFTTDYPQTWTLSPHADALAGNETTWTMSPDFIGSGDGQQVFGVYNDTLGPVLAPYAADDTYQRWSLVAEGLPIDDPTFSSTHLPALATEVCNLLCVQDILVQSSLTPVVGPYHTNQRTNCRPSCTSQSHR